MNQTKNIFYRICTTCKPNKSKTVRYAFPLMFAVFAALGAQTIGTANETYITVEPSTNSLRAGKAFYFDIYVTAHTPINAINLEVTFPKDQVKITGIDKGESVITLWTEEPSVKGSTVYLRGGTFRRGFMGQHLIATVNAVAIETGIAEIKVKNSLLLAGDGSGTEVSTTKKEKEKTKIYIASEDGVLPPGASELSGIVEVKILTDIDGDGEVSLADVSRFMTGWFAKNVVYDFNSDGNMTFIDFGIILSDSFFK